MRQRPWYERALKNLRTGSIAWTDVYQFYEKKKIGITASHAVTYGPKDGRFTIIAIDVLLDDVRKLILNEKPSYGAIVALGPTFLITLVNPISRWFTISSCYA